MTLFLLFIIIALVCLVLLTFRVVLFRGDPRIDLWAAAAFFLVLAFAFR